MEGAQCGTIKTSAELPNIPTHVLASNCRVLYPSRNVNPTRNMPQKMVRTVYPKVYFVKILTDFSELAQQGILSGR